MRRISLLVGLMVALAISARADERLSNFRQNDGFQWFYNGWDAPDILEQKTGYQIIQPPADEHGGGGRTMDNADLSKYTDHLIEIEMRLGEENEASEFRVVIRDWDGTSGVWVFPTKGLPTKPNKFVTLTSERPLGAPDEITHEGDEEGLNYEKVDSWQIQGDYTSNSKFHMEFKSLKLVKKR